MLRFNRILLKISGEILGTPDSTLDRESIYPIATQLKSLLEKDIQLGLVIGGGNFLRGTNHAQIGISRTTADYMGMLGTIMNAACFADVLSSMGVKNELFSALEFPSLATIYAPKKVEDAFSHHKVVLLAGGTGNPYFSTDSAAALRSIESKCDVFIKLTKVDGVYDKDPQKFKDAKKFDTLSYLDALTNPSIKVMDKTALSLCMEQNMPILVLNSQNGDLLKALHEEKVGTLIHS